MTESGIVSQNDGSGSGAAVRFTAGLGNDARPEEVAACAEALDGGCCERQRQGVVVVGVNQVRVDPFDRPQHPGRDVESLAGRERADPPDPERAMEFLREGFGQAVGVYVQARAGDGQVRFSPRESDRLERAMNDWLELYAACYGVDIDADHPLRKGAELLIDTENIKDVAVVLTRVPDDA